MAEESEKVLMTDQPPIAYPPVKRNIKSEIQDEQQEVNSVEEENWTLEVPTVLMLIPINSCQYLCNLSCITAYKLL